jgi:hypothetical protein
MPSTLNVLWAASAALLFWTLAGWPVARRIAPGGMALPIAPALGWALHSAATLPVLLLIGFYPLKVFAVSALVLIASLTALLVQRDDRDGNDTVRVPLWAVAGAVLLALAPAVAILPKETAEGVAFAAPIFDHSKVAIIDEMTRLGLPPGNSFFGAPGASSRLAYYYLWHFSAAQLALTTGATGWEADIALTWFTAFASLMLMVGFAVWLARASWAAVWVLLLSATGSLRLVIAGLFGPERLDALVVPTSGFGGWLFQSPWAPQHIASASCVVLALFVLAQLARRPRPLLLFVLALLLAASYGSSTWIGAFVLPVAAAAATVLLFIQTEPQHRVGFLVCSAAAAALAIAIAAPMLHDQLLATAARGAGSPVALHPYEVLGTVVPEPLRRVLDVPAYWLVLLLIELPAVSITGLIGLRFLLRPGLAPKQRATVLALAALLATGLITAWLFVSTVGDNNDLGWRAVLPAVMVLTIAAAVALTHWLANGQRAVATAAVVALLLGLLQGAALIQGYAAGSLSPAGKVFAGTPELWAAVRRHSAADERVANNPLFLQSLTPWPINLSWALLANRRSCYAGRDFAIPFTSMPRARVEAVERQFTRVFAGEATADEVRELADTYDCRIVVVTPEDGAWRRDPFAGHPRYRLAETRDGQWRIYRVAP